MTDIVKKALSAKRESKHIEFKQEFDSSSGRAWCELIKDIVAIANSGGGIIIFGLDNSGMPTGAPSEIIASIDPADIANKISKYTGLVDFELEIRILEKNKQKLAVFLIQGASIPFVFEKPGTYDIGGNQQRNAFSVGTVYFRHGAKSEPGTSEDIRQVIERQLEQIRRSWIKGVGKVVQAPSGSQIVAIQSASKSVPALATQVHAVKDPTAIPVRLTRDPAIASGSYLHEEVSEGIFDEINNVVDANYILARGQKVYFRIYAERHHVRQSEEVIALLLRNGLVDFYAPAFYWTTKIPNKRLAEVLAELYLYPTNRHGHNLTRVGILLGKKFCEWLFQNWQARWKGHPQPPSFYWTLKETMKKMENVDSRLIASHFSKTTKISIGGAEKTVKELFDNPDLGAAFLSKACMEVFHGNKEFRALARNLDYLTYGHDIQSRGDAIAEQVINVVGNRKPGEIIETAEDDV